MCLSGGADGADIAWGNAARSANHQVIHWSFANHNTKCLYDERCILTRNHLNAALEQALTANNSLHRRFPTQSNYVNDLIFRNYYQVRDASSIYAISHFTKSGNVAGGTAWAIQMFIDIHPNNSNVFVYCQTSNAWYAWSNNSWTISTPPQPSGIWAGVGSRKLTTGMEAINAIFCGV